MQEERYGRWKANVPLLYDWFTNHNLLWPSLSCRWGGVLEEGEFRSRQQLFFSEQTSGNYPNTLVVANLEIMKPRVAPAESLSQFNEEHKSPFLKKAKTIIHPGEVNRIKELPQNSKIVATHTDQPEVYIWNVDTQPNRYSNAGSSPSKPDMILTGHTDIAEFALAFSPSAPLVISGGRDKNVLLWDIKEPVPAVKPGGGKQAINTGSSPAALSEAARVPATAIFKAHTKTIEDVQFKHSSIHEFCSVGDDRCLILWDSRHGTKPAMKMSDAHEDDIHCIDCNPHEEHYILTGSADKTVRLFDVRRISRDGSSSYVNSFQGHDSAVLCVQWCPAKGSVFASSAADATLNIWDIDRTSKLAENQDPKTAGLFFKHLGHRDQVVDFHWNPQEPWLLASVSTDSKGGGTLQVWRVLDLLYRPEEEVLEELDKLEVLYNNKD